MYGKVVPIYFELDDYEYAEVLEKAEELEMHPNEYVKEMLTKENNTLNIYFSKYEYSTIFNFLKLIYDDDMTNEKLVRDLFLKAAKEEIINYKSK